MKDVSILRKYDILAYLASVIVLLLVVFMRKIKLDFGIDFSFLPPVHSSLNALAAVLLVLALRSIKRKDVVAHKRYIIGALICSILFLTSYVLYHITTPDTKFCREGWIRYVYFFILITHVILAGVILPFILLTFNRGFFGFVEKHKRLARWVYPLWLYVAVSGPIVYLMLRPCYG